MVVDQLPCIVKSIISFDLKIYIEAWLVPSLLATSNILRV